VKIFERWKAIDTRDKREKFTALIPAIMEAIRISDFRLYREITDGKSITYMIAGLNKEYGDVVESGLLFADPAVVERETDELIEKAIAFKRAYRHQYQQKAGWNYEPSFC
ncbi:toxin YdaT family protein, partial [Escherichia coli]